MDEVHTTFPELTIQLFQDLRGKFVAVCGIEPNQFREKMPIPDPKVMRVVWFPSANYFGFTLMLNNPLFAVKDKE